MEKYVVVGFVRSFGEFDGKKYSNVKIHCVRDAIKSNESGQITCSFKVKSSVFDEHPLSIGDSFEPMYDRYGNVVAY